MCDGRVCDNKINIANGFNLFFVNVSPILAKKIVKPLGNLHVYDFIHNHMTVGSFSIM